MDPKVVRGSRVKLGTQDLRLSFLPCRGGAYRSSSNDRTGGQATTRAEVAQEAMESNHTVMDQNSVLEELASLERQIGVLSVNSQSMQNILNKIAAGKARVMQLYVHQDVIKTQTRRQESYELSEKEVVVTPQLALLGFDDAEYPSQLRRFLFLAMSVTRCCIALDWLEPTPPSFNRWVARLSSMYYFEKNCYAIKRANRRRIGNSIWVPFA
ncbi:hypothetical protein NDU88_004569 [Pleurodeles waltl]|uniref:Uncharacterized protein n=1 Tax=Pleurodeles waltl TaxID=8319 RepID=A0AAV7MTU7_PLEWA|nr:hypothetical protein NDU88_004569 [Pleurodeles waltl]